MKSRGFVLIVVLLACAAVAPLRAKPVNAGTESAAGLRAPEPVEGFTIAILGDRTNGEPQGLDVLRAAVRDINLLRPDFVVHIGDMVPGYTRDMAEWAQDIRTFKDVIRPLEMPFYPLPGNHDVIGGAADPADRRGEELYKVHFGPLYYSFDHRDCHFVMLYSDEQLASVPRFSPQQIGWLARDLDRSGRRRAFVFVHKPAWEYPDGNWDEVHAVLKAHNVAAVFAGHFHHCYQSIERDGIRHFVMGATGARTYSPEAAGGLQHFSLLHIGKEGFHLALLRAGSVLPPDFVTNKDFHDMEKIRFLSETQTGVMEPLPSPEAGPVDATVRVAVRNPLERPMKVLVRGDARGGRWTFAPAEGRTLELPPKGAVVTEIKVACPAQGAMELAVPAIDVRYDYEKEHGESVPITLSRRVPLLRSVRLARAAGDLVLDGLADEPDWQAACRGRTDAWEDSPYASAEPSADVRFLPGRDGLRIFAHVPDVSFAYFPMTTGGRFLSDALFVGALPDGAGTASSERPPIVVIFPFAPLGEPAAFEAIFTPKGPIGLKPLADVRFAVAKAAGAWSCEGRVPWADLKLKAPTAGETFRLNIGVWDNDGTAFTELRTWAPYRSPAEWGVVSAAAGAAR